MCWGRAGGGELLGWKMGVWKIIFGGRCGYSGGKVRWARKNPPKYVKKILALATSISRLSLLLKKVNQIKMPNILYQIPIYLTLPSAKTQTSNLQATTTQSDTKPTSKSKIRRNHTHRHNTDTHQKSSTSPPIQTHYH